MLSTFVTSRLNEFYSNKPIGPKMKQFQKINYFLFYFLYSCLLTVNIYPQSQIPVRVFFSGLDGDNANEIINLIPKLKDEGFNFFIAGINYSFPFVAHPELRESNALTLDQITNINIACANAGIELIPYMQCFSHQSYNGHFF